MKLQWSSGPCEYRAHIYISCNEYRLDWDRLTPLRRTKPLKKECVNDRMIPISLKTKFEFSKKS